MLHQLTGKLSSSRRMLLAESDELFCRHWMLDQATDSLTSAILLKQRFEQPLFSRPTYKLLQVLLAPFFVLTAFLMSVIIGCASLDERPRIDGVYQEGAETAMVDRCSVGCCAHITGFGCCCGSVERKWLTTVSQRSQSLEARDWSSLALETW